jgi:murein DD-endopeptidase MepM/ murein hydrolase activator NlpD
VLAVADARVARVVDGMEQEVPGEPPLIALADADGNHVILDLGDGRFVLYAHLMPGSIRVAEGERVRRGEVLAQIGNSGNTLAPHLHLHVMSAPSGLAADGLPYVLDGYELLGRAASTEAFEEAEANGSPLAVMPADIPGAHAADLPLDQSIVRFAEP